MTHRAMVEETTTSPPSLATTVSTIAAVISSEHFPTGDRAALRRLSPGQPTSLAFCRFAFRHLPESWESRQDSWVVIVAGIALMCPNPHQPGRPAGRALAECDYSEKRLERLLAADEGTLHTLTLRAARFLAAKRETCNWVDFANLLLVQDLGKRESARLQIARDFYRNQKD